MQGPHGQGGRKNEQGLSGKAGGRAGGVHSATLRGPGGTGRAGCLFHRFQRMLWPTLPGVNAGSSRRSLQFECATTQQVRPDHMCVRNSLGSLLAEQGGSRKQ